MSLVKKILSITWSQIPGGKTPCVLCSDTGRNFPDLITSIRPLLEQDGIMVSLNDIPHTSSYDPGETGFMLNGRSLEDLVREADRAQFLCHSSKCQPFLSLVEITRNEEGMRCLKAPEILFRKAILASMED